MDHYLDIRLLPDPEFSSPVLMNALFAKLHRGLVQLQNNGIGVSFPGSGSRSLGDRLRIHGAPKELNLLMEQPWLNGMRDHIESGVVQPVPAKTEFCRVQRVQVKSNAERLRRRYHRRHPDTSESAIAEMIPDTAEKQLKLPYVQLKSTSNGQAFLLFIRQTPAADSESGTFNSYGLSASATLPWF